MIKNIAKIQKNIGTTKLFFTKKTFFIIFFLSPCKFLFFSYLCKKISYTLKKSHILSYKQYYLFAAIL